MVKRGQSEKTYGQLKAENVQVIDKNEGTRKKSEQIKTAPEQVREQRKKWKVIEIILEYAEKSDRMNKTGQGIKRLSKKRKSTERKNREMEGKDGPLSLQEPTDVMMESSQDSNRSNKTQQVNHVPVSHSSKPPVTANDTSSQNQTQVNGGISTMDRASLKNLPIEEAMQWAREIAQELEKLEEYHHGEGMRFQKMLKDMLWDYDDYSKDIGDMLSELGYAAVAMKMLKALNIMDIFENNDMWLLTYNTYGAVWNSTDSSKKLCKDFGEADAVRLLTFNCGHKPYLNAMQNKRVYEVIKASLNILYNMARNADVRHHFKENKTVEVVMPFINTDDDMLKVVTMLTLAHGTEEGENSKLTDETGIIGIVVKWIEMAIGNPTRRCRGFTSFELTQGLDKLAVNDANKIKILDAGALPLFVKMLEHEDAHEQGIAARCVWTLSKDKDVREKLLEHEGLVPVLEKLQDSSVELVAKNAKGALWVIKGENDPATMQSVQH